MKVLLKSLDARLRQLSPLTVTTIALCCVLVLGVADFFTPGPVNIMVFYVLPVALAGWGAGKRHAWAVSAVAAVTMFSIYSVLHQVYPHTGWVALWNNSTRFLLFGFVGWLAAEFARLTRSLEREVEDRTAQWKAEAQAHQTTATRLAEANERFEQVINNIGEVFWLTDVAKDQMFYISPGYERIWGRQCEALYREPRSWLAAVHPADRDGVARCAQADQARGSYDIEYRIIRPDGAVRWVRDRAFPVRNAQGEISRIAGLADDITEQKKSRETLQMQAAILENMAEGVVVTDEQGIVVLMNPAAERIWGYPRNETLGKPASIFSALPEPEATRVLREVLATLQAAGEWRGTFKNRRKDGAIIACDAIIRRVEIQGRVLMVAVEQDVTERLRTQEQLEMQARALAKKEELYRTLFELSPDGILLEDANGNILDANQAFCRTAGYSRPELLGQHVRRLVPPDGHGEVEAHLAALRAGQGLEHETENIRKNGERCLMRLNETPLTLPDGRQGILVVARDVTASKRAELTKEVFLALGSKLSAVGSPVEAARAVYAAADQLWKWDAATLDVYDPERERMEPLLFCDIINGQRREVAPAQPAGAPTPRMRRIMQQGAELILRKEADLQHTDSVLFGDTSRASASIMCVAMRRDGQPVGMLSIQSYTPNAYTQDDLRTLQALADHCGGALERIQAEAARRQSEELNRTILATTMDAFYALNFAADPGGAIIQANEAFCRLTGYSHDELLQMRMADLEAAESLEEVARHGARIIASGADRFETRHRRKDGQEIHTELCASRLGSDGKQVFGFVRDITERRRAEATRGALLSLGAELNTARTPADAARAVLATANQLWRWDAGFLDLYIPERECMEPVLFYDTVAGQRCEVPPTFPGGAISGRLERIMRAGPELILRQPSEMEHTDFVKFGDSARLSASLMYVPLQREGEPLGVLSLQSYTPNAYTAEDLQTLQALADHCGGALERIRAEQSLQEAHDRLDVRVRERTSELEAANAALRESEARLRLALEASNAGTWSWDVASNTSTWDDRYCSHYGLDPQAPKSVEAWMSRVHPGDRERLRSRVTGLLEGSESGWWDEEFRALHPTRGQCWMAGLGRIDRDPTGRAVRFSGINLDITQRKRAEEALRAQLGYIETIYQNAPVGLCVLDLDFRYVRINERLAAMNGLPVDQHLGRTVRDALPDLADGTEAICRQVIATGQPVLNVEIEGITAAQPGVTRTWVSSWVPLKEAGGRVSGVSVLIEEVTERKRLDQALRDSEAKYRRLHETMTDAFVRVEMDGRITEFNRAYQDMLGYTPEELSQLTYADITPDKWHAFEAQLVADQVMARGYSDVYEKEYRRKDGTVFPVELRTIVQRDQSGQPVGMWAIVRDITERRRAAEELRQAHDLLEKRVQERTAELQATNTALRESEERYRTLAETSPDAIFILDRNIRVAYVNSAAAALWGRQPEGLVGRSQAEIFPPEIARRQSQVVAGILAGGETVRRDVLLPFPGGERWLETRLLPMLDPQGLVRSVMGVSRDITERKRAEEALKEAERLQKAILENIPDPVWLKDVQGRFLAVNQALAHFYGRPAEAIVGKTALECARPEANRLEQEDRRVMQGRSSVVVEEPHTDAQGQTWWFESVKSPLFNEQAEVIGTVGIARDITGRKHAHSLLQAQRDLGANLSLTSDLAGALKCLLEIVMRMGGVDSGATYLLNEDASAMDMVAHHGGSPSFNKAVAHWGPDSAGMRLMRRGQPIFSTFRELADPQDEVRRREGLRAVVILPLSHNRKLIGALTLGSHTADVIPAETRIVIEAIAAQAAGAIARIRAETESHRLERQLLEISDREQARIGQDIHDGLCQQLVSLAFDANSLHRDLLAGRRPTKKMAERIARVLDEAITESRQLSRGLFPVRLETEGLPPALEELAKVTRDRFKLQCRFRNRGAIAVKDRTVATHLFRIAQEAVTNAVKHSQARAISISLSAQDDQLELRVEDDGRGIRPKVSQDRAGMGLHIMDYRARSIGGMVRIARRPRGGTTVLCCVPRQLE